MASLIFLWIWSREEIAKFRVLCRNSRLQPIPLRKHKFPLDSVMFATFRGDDFSTLLAFSCASKDHSVPSSSSSPSFFFRSSSSSSSSPWEAFCRLKTSFISGSRKNQFVTRLNAKQTYKEEEQGKNGANVWQITEKYALRFRQKLSWFLIPFN